MYSIRWRRLIPVALLIAAVALVRQERESSFTISEAEEGRREVQGGNKEKCRRGEFRGGGAVSSLPSFPFLSSYPPPKGAREGGTMLLMMIAFQEGEEERKEETER